MTVRMGGEPLQDARPAFVRIENATHLVGVDAVAIQMAMLENDPRVLGTLGNEMNVDLGLQALIELPSTVDAPGQYQTAGRIPNEHAPPITFAPIHRALK